MPIIVDDKWLDVDFTKQPEYTFGYTGDDPAYGEAYEDNFPVMTEKEIDEAIEKQDALGLGLDDLVVNIFNQGKEGSCVANAYAQAHQVLQAKQLGKENVTKLSAISLYKQIGRSASSGANVTDGANALSEVGILPLDTPENRARFGNFVMPATGFSKSYPQGDWKSTAKLFRGIKKYRCRTVQGMFTASLRGGRPIVVGREGHSIMYATPTLYKGRRVFKYPNSWGMWGDKGYGYDSQSQIEKSASGAWAIVSVVFVQAV